MFISSLANFLVLRVFFEALKFFAVLKNPVQLVVQNLASRNYHLKLQFTENWSIYLAIDTNLLEQRPYLLFQPCFQQNKLRKNSKWLSLFAFSHNEPEFFVDDLRETARIYRKMSNLHKSGIWEHILIQRISLLTCKLPDFTWNDAVIQVILE